MKKIYYLFVAVPMTVMAVSCENADFLNTVPETKIAPETYYKDESQFKLSVIGAYEALHASNIAGQTVQGGTYHTGLAQMMSAPSDEIFTIQNASDSYGAFTDFIRASFTEANPGLRRFWDAFYAGISRCNAVLAHKDDIADSPRMQQYVAEVRFLRGFYYWYLAQVFGGVPIVGFHSDGQEPRSSLEKVYAYIFDDLEYAYEHLAADRSTGVLGPGSATKWTAAAYIGKICNYLASSKRSEVGKEFVSAQPLNDFSFVDEKAMWEKSRTYLKDIIENGKDYYSLVTDFTNLFRETTKTEQYKECLMIADFYLSGTEGAFPASGVFAFAPGSGGQQAKGQTPDVWGRYAFPSPRMFSFFSEKDPRRDWFFTCNGSGSVADGTLIEETAIDGIVYVKPWDRGTATQSNWMDNQETQTFCIWSGDRFAVGKFRLAQIGQVTTHTFTQHGMSIPLMRLAEVYLLYAEALYYTGDEALAREQFKIILKRACKDDEALVEELTALYRKDNFVDELLETRERELCFEGSRKFDLFRYNLTDKAITSLFTEELGRSSKDEPYYGYNSYIQFKTKNTSSPVLVFNSGTYFVKGGEPLKDNWRPYKIWAPISALQMSVNKNLTQNANW